MEQSKLEYEESKLLPNSEQEWLHPIPEEMEVEAGNEEEREMILRFAREINAKEDAEEARKNQDIQMLLRDEQNFEDDQPMYFGGAVPSSSGQEVFRS